MANKKAKLSIFEIVWYSITGLVSLWGLTYIVLGLIAAFYPATSDKNELLKASETIAKYFGLGFLYWGIIILAIGVVAAAFVLCIKAKETDREVEKSQRRAARLAAQTEARTAKIVAENQEENKAD